VELSLDWINAIVTLGGLLVAVGVVVQQTRQLARSIDGLNVTVEKMREHFSRKVDEVRNDASRKVDEVRNDAANSRERLARIEAKINHRSKDD